MSTCAMGVAEFAFVRLVDCFESASETSASCLYGETLTDMLHCHEHMPAAERVTGMCEHVAEAGPGIVEVPLVGGQCSMVLPEPFRSEDAFLSGLDWSELCEKGLHDMEQRELRGDARATGFVWH